MREDPGAHRDVEHRDGLVGDEQLGLEDEARRDRDALALAAGELVRVAVGEELRQARGRPAPAPRCTASRRSERDPIPWMTSGSATVVETREARVERLVGILVDDLHPTSERPQVALRGGR